jgi:hypothetical protein
MESLIIVMVHNDVGMVIVVEQVVPDASIGSKRVMENKFSLRSILFDQLFDISVERLEKLKWTMRPWLIDWFQSTKSGV